MNAISSTGTLEETITTEEPTQSAKKSQKITPAIVKEIEKLIPLIEKGKLTQKEAGTKCKVPESTFSTVLDKLKNGEDPSKRKNYQEVTPEIVEKIKTLFAHIKEGKLERKEVAKACNISSGSLREIMRCLENGENPIKKKRSRKVTDEVVKRVKDVLLECEGQNLSRKQHAAKCKLSLNTFVNIMKKLEKDENPVRTVPKISEKFMAIIEKKVKEVLPQVKEGKLTEKEAAQKCKILEKTFRTIAEKLEKEEAEVLATKKLSG